MSADPTVGARRTRAATVVALAAAVAALASAVAGLRPVLSTLDDQRRDVLALPKTLRDDPVGLYLGLDTEGWRRLETAVGRGDRYAIVSGRPEQHEVRNYAAYSLLPAIQVSDPEAADAVLYYGAEPPPGVECARIGRLLCLAERERGEAR